MTRPLYATAYYVNLATGEETQCKREMFVRHYTKEVGFKTRESRDWLLAEKRPQLYACIDPVALMEFITKVHVLWAKQDLEQQQPQPIGETQVLAVD